MSDRDSVEPVHVNDACWLYGEREGLTVAQEYRDTAGALVTTLTVTVPWDKVARARGRRPMGRSALDGGKV